MHAEIWSSTWKWYIESFAESFAWSRKRKEEAKKREAHEKMNALQGIVKEAREATHNSPEVGGCVCVGVGVSLWVYIYDVGILASTSLTNEKDASRSAADQCG